MMASGTIGHGAEYAGMFDFARVGGVVTKTITYHPRAGNSAPRTAETPSGMLNSIGLTNPGLDGFIVEKVPALQALPTARVVSIAGTSNDEFAEMTRRFNDIPHIDALELNISSPNMKDGGQLFGMSSAGRAWCHGSRKGGLKDSRYRQAHAQRNRHCRRGSGSGRRRRRQYRAYQHPAWAGRGRRLPAPRSGQYHRRSFRTCHQAGCAGDGVEGRKHRHDPDCRHGRHCYGSRRNRVSHRWRIRRSGWNHHLYQPLGCPGDCRWDRRLLPQPPDRTHIRPRGFV